MRFARKADATQSAIVAAIRAAGWECWYIGEPADLLCYHHGKGIWRVLEAKTPNRKNGRYHPRKDQAEQNDFCARTNTPRVTSPEAALEALQI